MQFEGSSDLVVGVESGAVAWLERNLRRFDPLACSHADDANDALKAAAELALVCSLALESDLAVTSSYRSFAQYLWDEVFESEAIQEHLLLSAASVPAVDLYACLRDCGYEDETFRTRLRALLDEGSLLSTERTPTGELDLLSALATAGLSDRIPRTDSVYPRTLLAACPSLYRLTDADAYALTHALFFLTDFGRHRASCIEPEVSLWCRTSLPRLLGFYLKRGNWDIAGELLIALASVGGACLPPCEEAWTLIFHAQNTDGSFPGGDLSRATNTGDERQRFRADYHTTLVVLLAIWTVLRH